MLRPSAEIAADKTASVCPLSRMISPVGPAALAETQPMLTIMHTTISRLPHIIASALARTKTFNQAPRRV